MRISVIIPTYNRKILTVRAVRSVLNQTYCPDEIVVVDDGSVDGSLDVFAQFGDSITVLNQSNKGVSAARNSGILHSSGDWLAFLDSDDEWLPEKLEKQVKYNRENTQIKISQTNEIWIRNEKRVNPLMKHQKYGGWIFKKCLPLCIVSPSAVMIHRSVFDEVGLFDETLPVCEDYDLWLRIARRYEIGLLPENLVIKYGGHDDQLSQKYWGMDRFRIQAMEKHIGESLPSELRKALLVELVKKCRIVSEGAEKRGNENVKQIYQKKLEIYEEILKSYWEDSRNH